MILRRLGFILDMLFAPPRVVCGHPVGAGGLGR
jgi:hypothetical protein